MSRSKDIAEILGLTEADNPSNTSLVGGGGGVTSYDYDSSGALLAADSSGYEDGSLHYLSKLREMYVWDDSDGGFFKVDALSESKLAGPQPPNHQGSSYGYMAGGNSGSHPPTNVIDKFSLTSDGNATDVGDLVTARQAAMGFSSPEHGYAALGTVPSYTTSIERWAFASDGNSAFYTSVGGTSVDGRQNGASSFSRTHGYMAGGYTPTQGPYVNVIEKFSFSTSSGNLDVGDLLYHTKNAAGQMSSTHGYVSTGLSRNGPSGNVFQADIIQKFPFAADGDATDVGNTVHASRYSLGASSTTHGYLSGGDSPAGAPSSYDYDVIQKFAFASDGDATDVGDLPEGLQASTSTCVSSTESGYNVGSTNIINPTAVPSGNSGAGIKKYSFSSDENSTEVGDLTVVRKGGSFAHV